MNRISRNSHGGFSIIESLVVMFIIVLLVSIVIPGWLGRSVEEVPAAGEVIDSPVEVGVGLGVEREESVEPIIGE